MIDYSIHDKNCCAGYQGMRCTCFDAPKAQNPEPEKTTLVITIEYGGHSHTLGFGDSLISDNYEHILSRVKNGIEICAEVKSRRTNETKNILS